MLKVVRVGDWGAAMNLTRGMAGRFNRAMDQAVHQEAQNFRKHVLKAFKTSGNSNGKPWQKNEPWTIKRKRSSKPLIDKGDLFGSIVTMKVGDSAYFVGVPNNARSYKGEQLTKIGEVHEFGRVITMTVTKKQFYYIMNLLKKFGNTGKKSSGKKLRIGGTLIIRIPERSFLRSTMDAHFKQADVEKRMMTFVAQKMGWSPGKKSP